MKLKNKSSKKKNQLRHAGLGYPTWQGILQKPNHTSLGLFFKVRTTCHPPILFLKKTKKKK
jgi:hypothetical protein